MLYLDIDYMDGYRVFTWDAERFPDPAGLMRELDEQGFRLVTILDPGVKVDEDYAVYPEGRERGLFCKTRTGRRVPQRRLAGHVRVPGLHQSAQRGRGGATSYAVLLDAGVAGIWCDMNEPTLFVPAPATMPDDVVHHGDGEPRLHAQVHNLYGQLMARATREGLRAAAAGARARS